MELLYFVIWINYKIYIQGFQSIEKILSSYEKFRPKIHMHLFVKRIICIFGNLINLLSIKFKKYKVLIYKDLL
jgi:hypothetical protein